MLKGLELDMVTGAYGYSFPPYHLSPQFLQHNAFTRR